MRDDHDALPRAVHARARVLSRLAPLAAFLAAAAPSAAQQPPALPAPPAVLTGQAERVTARAATIRGTVDGYGAIVTVRVEYGPTPQYGTVSALRRVRGAGRVSIRLRGLRPGRTYPYRLRGTSVSGSAVGARRTFRTTGVVQSA